MAIYLSEQALEDRHDKVFLQAVNEVYFGRTPGIMRVFNAFCDWREKYVNNRLIGKGNISAQTDPDLKKLTNELERQFGYYSISIVVVQSDTANMMTVIPVFGTGPDKIEITKEGYRFKEDAEVAAIFVMFAGMLFDAKYTNEECFAIFLHEVGHTFQNSGNGIMFGLNWAIEFLYIQRLVMSLIQGDIEQATLAVISMPTASNSFNKVATKAFNTIVTDNKFIGKLYQYISFCHGLFDTLSSIPRMLLRLPTLPIKLIIAGFSSLTGLFVNPFGTYVGFMGERFADGFPASYGFSINISNALFKMDENKLGPIGRVINMVPVVSHIYNALLLPGVMLITIGDEHPETASRSYSVLEDLKADLKDPNLDPKLKTKLKKELAEYEKNMDLYFAEAKRINNPQVCKAWLEYFIYYKANGGLKYKVMDPYSTFRQTTNKTADDVNNGIYKNNFIKNAKIK